MAKDNSGADRFEVKKVFSHGFPHHPTALAYDTLQSLVAIGNKTGTIRIFGKAGLEVCLQHELGTPVNQLIFITNKGYLISITGDDTINLWSLRERPARWTHRLPLDREKVAKCAYTYGSDWLYVGTNKGNIKIVRAVEGLALSGYTISYHNVVERQGTERNKPGAVIDILEHPLEQGKLLLGYNSGLIVLWDLVTKQVNHRYHVGKLLTSLCWISSGKEFVTSYYDGAIAEWSLKNNREPKKLFFPYDAQRSSLTSDNKFSPIENLRWVDNGGNSLLVFTGGTPFTDHTPYITVMQGRSMSKLQCHSNIHDFIFVHSSPSAHTPQKSKLLLLFALCKNGMMVFDISEVGKYNPQYNVPLVLDLHKPAVTCVQYVDDCPHNLIGSLHSVQSRQLVTVKEQWPFKGGKWGGGVLEAFSSGLIITGHCDGSIKFWLADLGILQPSITINTRESFERVSNSPQQQESRHGMSSRNLSELPNRSINASLMSHQPTRQDTDPTVSTEETCDFGTPYITSISDHDFKKDDGFLVAELPSSSDLGLASTKFFPVSQLILNTVDWSLTVVNYGLCVMIYSFQPISEIKYLPVYLGSSHTPMPKCDWKALPKAPVASEGAGFHLQFCCQCVPPAGAADVEITCVEYSSKCAILMIGLTCGLVIVDTVGPKCLLVETNENNFIASNSKEIGAMKVISALSKKVAAAGAGAKASNSQLCVKAVSIVELNHDKHSHTPTCCLWVGTDKGNVIMMTLNAKVELIPSDIALIKLHHPVIAISFLDGFNNIISTPTQQCSFESSICVSRLEEHIDENHESLAADTVKHFNVKLRYKLPLDDAMFFGMVKQAGLFPLDTGAYIETLNTRAQKVGYFLQYLVEPAASEYLPKLLKVMKNSKEPSLVKLAKEIQEHLAKEILVAERASKMTTTQHVVLCSEVLCKVYTFPDNTLKATADLVGNIKTQTAIVRTKICQIPDHDHPCLISLTLSGDILLHSLPSLRSIAVIPCEPLRNLRALRTFYVAADGSSAVYMSSPSEIQRLSLLKHNEEDFANIVHELHVAVANPELLPANRRARGSSSNSFVNYDELFKENTGGHPLFYVAEIRAGSITGATSTLSDTSERLSVRGQRLDDVRNSTARMRDHADAFYEEARALKRNFEWWKL